MKEIKDIIKAYDLIERIGQKAVLATVVQVEGSSYRSPGARMLISEEGHLTGAISGGCLEGDALRKALLVMQEQKPMLATYDTSDEDDAIFGMGLGCRGIIHVLLEPLLPQEVNNPITLLKEAVKKREASVLITFFSLSNKWNARQGTHLHIRKDQHISEISDLNTGALSAEIAWVFDKCCSKFLKHLAPGQEDMQVFLEYLQPSIALIIGGAGNDIMPVVKMAEILGWEVTLIDGRPNYANKRRFANCSIMVSDPEQALQQLSIDNRTAFVLMSHNYNYDKAMLRSLIGREVPYLGMLGPRKKGERMVAELKEEGINFSVEQQATFFHPIGLDLGAETAEEIALAVIAEIKAIFADKGGKPLRDKEGGIHEERTSLLETADA